MHSPDGDELQWRQQVHEWVLWVVSRAMDRDVVVVVLLGLGLGLVGGDE